MSFAKPGRVWWKPIDAQERLWIILSLGWCVVLFIVMVAMVVKGKQNPPDLTYRVEKAVFDKKTSEFVEKYKTGEKDAKGNVVVRLPENVDSFLQAKYPVWQPAVMEMKKGQSVHLRMSSFDYQHGFSLQPGNINLQILPDYEYVTDLRPTKAGEYAIICNEYCGLLHHKMVGKIIVKE